MGKKYRYFVGDFETTVTGEKNQDQTEVWASGLCELYTENAIIDNCIESTFNKLYSMARSSNIKVFYHNLKFDGSFILDFLLRSGKFTQALYDIGDSIPRFLDDKQMPNYSYKYIISDTGQWYQIKIKIHNHYIEFQDSLKLLPFSVEKLGKDFKTKHRKLTIDYVGARKANGYISVHEKEYLKNDLFVVKECLETLFDEGHNKMTIGACCLSDFKSYFDKQDYKMYFPDLSKVLIDKEIYGSSNADEYIRRSYRGGWCYVVPEKAKKIKENGLTADVNSLYPSVMHSESGNYYPVGLPTFFTKEIPKLKNRYYFVRFRCRFKIKNGYLPFIQIKNSLIYKGTENLTTSDYVFYKNGKKYTSKFYYNELGERKECRPTLTMSCTDFELFKKHYNIYDLEILDGCYFYQEKGLFDCYIDKWKKVKQNSTGAIRSIAKLFSNNLYGKLSSSDRSSYKIVYLDDEENVKFLTYEAHEKEVGYIAVGAAVTSYARNFTISAAQKNYYGKNKRGFIYADTDSIHCDLTIDELKGINIHPTNYCCWKIENHWKQGWFVRQKTYIEYTNIQDEKEIEPFYLVKCAGMPKKCKDLFIDEVLNGKKNITDFNIGLKVSGKLQPKRVKGGVVLVDTDYEMR